MSRTIASERIDRLFALAQEAERSGRTEQARTLIRRARRIAERHRLSVPREFDRFTCEDCDRVLLPGRNARARTRSGHVVVTCDCGSQSRYTYA